MLIVADENMPRVREWFAPLGEVRVYPGRALRAEHVRDADIVLVRSVTRVDRALLEGSRVRFVGSATIGTDHLDIDFLQRSDIAYANAPGCNATAVVEYVLSSLCAVDGVFERLLNGGVVGIIGFGNVGSRLYARLRQLGINCIAYDPLLQSASDFPARELSEVLGADVVCCHAPLTRTGAHPTFHLLNAVQLQKLKPGALLLNAGRGAVVDNAALLVQLNRRDDLRVVLDVWEGEPAIDRALLQRVTIGTPHIAGYSWDGKLAGTRMVLEACCRFFAKTLAHESTSEPSAQHIAIDKHLSHVDLIRAALHAVYDVRLDDRQLRENVLHASAERAASAFDALRKNYPERRELSAVRIDNWADLNTENQRLLLALGFSAHDR